MHASEPIKISIERPYDEVYDFLADPKNFPRWAANPGSGMQHVTGNDYLVDLPVGRRVIRLTPHNKFGVLDYQVIDKGRPVGQVVPVRLHANGTGCELVLIWLQRPGASDQQFRSDVEWVQSDLARLKSLLESRAAPMPRTPPES